MKNHTISLEEPHNYYKKETSPNQNSKTSISHSEENQSKSNSYDFVKIFNEDSVFLTATKSTPKSSNLKDTHVEIPDEEASPQKNDQ